MSYVVKYWSDGRQVRRRFSTLSKALKFAESALGSIILASD